jgi:hypothetical protein
MEPVYQETLGGDADDLNYLGLDQHLGEWVATTCQGWRDHYEANFDRLHQEYYRLWRGQWTTEDRTRDSERCQLIAPALQQAVESSVAEIETASFQGDKIFDIEDDVQDKDRADIALLRKKLHEDFELAHVRPAIGECLINAAVFGTGIGELVVEQVTELVPGTQPLDEMTNEIGVMPSDRPLVKLVPIQPRNFLIDPSATSVDDAMGVAIEEFVPAFRIDQLKEEGVYRDVEVGIDPTDAALEADALLSNQPVERVRVIRYYGLVPRQLLVDEGVDESELKTDSAWQEACVVIANGGVVLKASVNPYMTQDRPVVAFPWDIVPSRFWGRGVCEKGYSSQKALDAEMRARIDALALTTHPMMAVDATRIPRGSKFEVRPGKMLLTNGDPKASIMPFSFGQVNQITFAQAQALQTMVQAATGAFDGASMAQNPGQEATSAGVAMSLGAVIKRQKRTLINFQDKFLKPLIRKAAVRYMQFGDNYPVRDYKFNVISSLGVVAREYEIGQLSQILQTQQPGTPAHGAVVKAIIEHLNTSSREEILATIEQASQPNPAAQQAQQAQMQAQMALQAAQAQLLQAQAAESASRATKYNVEAQLAPRETVLKYSDMDKDGKVDTDFKRKIDLARMLMEEERFAIEKEERQARMQQEMQAQQQKAKEQEMLQQMMQQNQGALAGVLFEDAE